MKQRLQQRRKTISPGALAWLAVAMMIALSACDRPSQSGSSSPATAGSSTAGNASPLSSATLRNSSTWTTNTSHPAYQFYSVASRGHLSESSCREYGGTPSTDSWAGNRQMLTQGVISGRDASLGTAVAIGYTTRSVVGIITARMCKFQVR